MANDQKDSWVSKTHLKTGFGSAIWLVLTGLEPEQSEVHVIGRPGKELIPMGCSDKTNPSRSAGLALQALELHTTCARRFGPI